MFLSRPLRWSMPSIARKAISVSYSASKSRTVSLRSLSAGLNQTHGSRHASSFPPEHPQPNSSSDSNPKVKKSSSWTRLAISGVILGGVYGWDHYFNARTLERNTRTLWNGIMLTLDYKLNYDPDNLESMNAVHERAAARLLHVCRKNGGLYIKAGQSIGIQVAILPKPYHALAQMFDSAPRLAYEDVRKVIRDELGMWPEEVFKEFDEIPIGSASIAQVHRARLHTGEEVAVKVQRPDIRKHAQWDLLAFRTLMKLYERVFDLPLSFASQYVSDQILLETQFDHERLNTERIRSYVLNDPPRHLKGGVAYVPKVYGDLSTERLLVLEYIAGAMRMTDLEGIKKLGLDGEKVMKSVCEVFAAQVFRWGFVNADPHPSNVLIRRHPSNPKTHQVVLIDHGLSINLPPTFRYQYCSLWKSLFARDVEGIKSVCKQWGIDLGEGGFGAQMLGSAVLLQGWDPDRDEDGDGLGGKGAKDSHMHMKRHWKRLRQSEDTRTKEEKEADEKRALVIQRKMKETVKNFLQNYEMIPKELIFLGRSMEIIQSNNRALGSPVDRLSILAKGANDGLYEMTIRPPPLSNQLLSPETISEIQRNASKSWIRRFISSNIDWFKLRLAIAGMETIANYSGLIYAALWVQRNWRVAKRRLGLTGKRRKDEQESGVDFMERHVMDMAKELGVEITEEAFRG